jgi:hypothetical protein
MLYDYGHESNGCGAKLYDAPDSAPVRLGQIDFAWGVPLDQVEPN